MESQAPLLLMNKTSKAQSGALNAPNEINQVRSMDFFNDSLKDRPALRTFNDIVTLIVIA
jgi:hypothetical protein